MEIVSKEKIPIEKGFLYFLGRDGFVYKVSLNRSKMADKTPQRVSDEYIEREKGYVYFIKDGYVCRAEQNKKGNPERRKFS
jgi:hypothetical protein